jgi:hypothetical protein
MARNRFVKPETVRLSISDGDWIEVKKRLTAGEYRERLAREYVHSDDNRLRADLRQQGIALVVSYVVDWSFTDDGRLVPFSEDALKSVDVDTFREILQAVEAHDDADDAARSAEKNAPAGASS